MKDILLRLRAALTPQAVLLLCALMLLLYCAAGVQMTDDAQFEKRVSEVLSSVEGAGRVDVVIRSREIGNTGTGIGASQGEVVVCGAVAVAQGADDPRVALELRQALSALLGLPASSVSIVTGGK